ncbi:protein FAR1-RELATED SEQUENCE 5-like [Lotus japonicus]|uniref:protein FAR1-RELATED SEQUENCE 5-like n=1 Tax=Lotus japonicus TaxID=34305 RepID=UPI00258B2814|nr:protein FAR1-RELATED SEQUENCE 5-like [Lotus japonicus]
MAEVNPISLLPQPPSPRTTISITHSMASGSVDETKGQQLMDDNGIGSSSKDFTTSILDTSDIGGELNSKPEIGMEFESIEKVREFYNSFAKKNGFGVRVRSSKPKRAVLVCCNEGQHKVKISRTEEIQDSTNQTKRKCSTIRSGCEASLIVSRGTTESKWMIKSFNNDHNHIMVSPKSVSYMRCHKKMSVAAKSLVEKFEEEGIPTGKVAAIFNDGDSTFTNRDCWNYIRNVRRKNLDVGDAQAVFDYCKRKQVENSNFFYAIQCDEDSRMVNLFWMDARSRLSYQLFGDVITFDTTYKTNKYSMPFAPFVGLNNHSQSILYGCVLLQDESEASFVWLFKTWLQAMGGKKPISIITDQDLAMKAALAKVFPESRHRLCLWHIIKKFPEKLAHIYHKQSIFKRDMKRCIRGSHSIQSFEEEWMRIMVEYNLKENEWLQGLYKIRESWIPIYNRSTFFAGMNTTQRSESINAFFDSFVDASTKLQEFVLTFEKAVESRLEAERKENYESRHKSRILSTGQNLRSMRHLYTPEIFLLNLKVSNCYDARDTFTVDIDLDSQIAKCGCELYEFMGILCRHILVSFQAKGVVQIPSHFIMERWTKDANRGLEDTYNDNDLGEKSDTLKILRRVHVQREASFLADLAEESEEAYNFIISEMKQTHKSAAAMKTSEGVALLESSEKNVNQVCSSEQVSEPPQLTIGNPHLSKGKHVMNAGSTVTIAELARKEIKMINGYITVVINCPYSIYPLELADLMKFGTFLLASGNEHAVLALLVLVTCTIVQSNDN